MCESKAVLIENGKSRTILENIALLEITNEKIVLYTVTGEKVELKHKIIRIDFIKHTIYLKPVDN